MFKMAKFRICRCVTCACVLAMCRHSAGIFVLNVFHFVYKTLHAMASKKWCVQVHVCACLDTESLPSTVALSSAVLAQRYPLNGCSTVYVLVTCSRDLLAVATLRTIASNGKEQPAVPALFVHEDDERVPLTPCVVYSGHNLEQAEFLHLCVDKERLFMVKNAEEGVIAIMSAFFVLNVVYRPKYFNTSAVLERLCFGLNVIMPSGCYKVCEQSCAGNATPRFMYVTIRMLA
ncbi:uncharacterized protein LOC125940505 [Dermacentor silvarum]|uniref:uncharacterized protein LOC125940505 n=1 Tax=Dermacentor silvarum TaxID=543639 RepID=UPI002100EA93|nr:uncharacterized protein LOC125940505 [Dermacentor silvarum]